MAELLDYAERLTRAEIKTWPKGTYDFIDHIDSDGFSDDADPDQGRHHGATTTAPAGRLHRLLAAGEGRAQLDAQLHAFAAPISACAACWPKDVPEQRRRVPLHRR